MVNGIVPKFGIHEKKLTYMAFVVAILVCLYFNPFGVGVFWAIAVIALMIWYSWMAKRKVSNEVGKGNEKQ